MGTKHAVLIAINRYANGHNLKGCVPDSIDMHRLLTDTYGFLDDNIRTLWDTAATYDGIVAALTGAVARCVPGDVLVVHYSGHGSQVPDRYGDETDGYDEIICPHDMDWNRPLTDDILRGIFMKLPPGVFLAAISDSCHSGTLDKNLAYRTEPRYMPNPNQGKPRENKIRGFFNWLMHKHVSGQPLHYAKPGAAGYVFLSGCRDDQTSADALIERGYRGAMTWSLTKTARLMPTASWPTIVQEMRTLLKRDGYDQVPTLSGTEDALAASLFELPSLDMPATKLVVITIEKPVIAVTQIR